MGGQKHLRRGERFVQDKRRAVKTLGLWLAPPGHCAFECFSRLGELIRRNAHIAAAPHRKVITEMQINTILIVCIDMPQHCMSSMSVRMPTVTWNIFRPSREIGRSGGLENVSTNTKTDSAETISKMADELKDRSSHLR